MNGTDPVTLARAVLAAEERHDGTPAHEADMREERWEFYEELCTSGAPALAYAVIDLTAERDTLAEEMERLAVELECEASLPGYLRATGGFDRAHVAARIRAALNGETNA